MCMFLCVCPARMVPTIRQEVTDRAQEKNSKHFAAEVSDTSEKIHVSAMRMANVMVMAVVMVTEKAIVILMIVVMAKREGAGDADWDGDGAVDCKYCNCINDGDGVVSTNGAGCNE